MPHDSSEENTQQDAETSRESDASQRPEPAPPAPIATPHIPDHQLLRRIGSGSYGEVWLARNVMGTYRAVKIVYRRTFSSDRPYEREFTGIQKFEPISRSHEGLVDVLQIGRNDRDGYFYYVMELADDASVVAAPACPPEPRGRRGKARSDRPNQSPNGAEVENGKTGKRENESIPSSPLPVFPFSSSDRYIPKTLSKEIHNRGRLPADECLGLSLTLTSALGHLHKHGLIHRDIKPSNIIFVNGIPKLADIGLVADAAEARSFVGTEGFIPPEGPGTARADLYSLGKVVYEICTGKDRQDFPELPTLMGEDGDRTELLELNEVIVKACEDEPTQRYQSAEEMHGDLMLMQSGKSLKRFRTVERRLALLTKAGVSTALVAVVTAVGYLYQQHESQRFQKLADENRRLAGEEARQRQRVLDTFSRSDFAVAGQLLERGQFDQAVAYFCRALRSNPTNHLAGSKLITTLLYNDFVTVVHPPLLYEGDTTTKIAVSPDGTRAVLCSQDSLPRVWELVTGKPLTPPLQHEGPVTTLAFSPDGTRVATGSRDTTARVWDAATGAPVTPPLKHEPDLNFTGMVAVVVFTPDGKRVVTGAGNREARIWDAADGKLLATLKHDVGVDQIKISADGSKLVTKAGQQYARVWDTTTGAPLTPPLKPQGFLSVVGISPDGAKVVTGTAPGNSVEVWDVATGQHSFPPLRLKGEVNQWVMISPDGKKLAAQSNDGLMQIWDLATGQPTTSPIKLGATSVCGLISPDNTKLITGLTDGVAHVLDLATGEALSLPVNHEGVVWHLAMSPDGIRLITASLAVETSTQIVVRVLDLLPSKALPSPILVYALNSDRTKVAGADAAASGRVRVFDLSSHKPLSPPITLEREIVRNVSAGRTNTATRFLETVRALSPDGTKLVTATMPSTNRLGIARIWDMTTGEQVGSDLRHDGIIQSLAISSDGTKLVTGSVDKTARVWDLVTGAELLPPLKHDGVVSCLAISPDGSRLVTGCFDGAHIWDLQTGQPLSPALRSNGSIRHVAITPDGKKFVTGSSPMIGFAQVWDMASGKALAPPVRNKGTVESLAISPDGATVASGSFEGEIRVWDIETGRDRIRPLKHTGYVFSLAFSPDGKRVASASNDGSWRVWDVATGEPLTQPMKRPSWILGFSSDGARVVTGSGIWDIPQHAMELPAWFIDLAEALAGLRLNENGTLEDVGAGKYFELRDEVLKMAETEPIVGWAKWFVADRRTRSISPLSNLTASAPRSQK